MSILRTAGYDSEVKRPLLGDETRKKSTWHEKKGQNQKLSIYGGRIIGSRLFSNTSNHIITIFSRNF